MNFYRRFDSKGKIIPDSIARDTEIEYIRGRCFVRISFTFVEDLADRVRLYLRAVSSLIDKQCPCSVEIKWLEHRTVMAIALGRRIQLVQYMAEEHLDYTALKSSNDVEKQGEISRNTEHLKIICAFKLIR